MERFDSFVRVKQQELIRREEICQISVRFKLWLGGLSTVAATLADNQPSLGCFYCILKVELAGEMVNK